MRPVNCLIGGLSIGIAAVLAGAERISMPVALAIISGMLITAAANTINDYFDIDIDRINRPDRPLPAGELSPKTARCMAIFLFGCGVFFSIFINFYAILVTLLSTVLLIAYSAYLKRMLLWGNISVSLMTAIAFLYGALAAGRWQDGVIPAVFAFFFHLGREILKDLEDRIGDASADAQTFPLRFGLMPTLTLITAIYLVLISLTVVPFVIGHYGRAYLLTVLLGVDVVLLVVLAILWRKKDIANLSSLSNVLKADMLVGLIAIYLG